MTGIAGPGTNGKTTTANWIADLMNRLGTPCACIGTLGCTLNGKALTPERVDDGAGLLSRFRRRLPSC